MIRQYIGARYVPKFFENPNQTAEWLPNVIYEPLTIVTYANNSYTSKKTVPASIGNPAENPDYWVSTGIYSAQVEQYRQEVEQVQADVDDLTDVVNILNNKKYIFVGDSYGVDGSGSDIRWITKCTNNMGLVLNSDYYVACAGGIGFNSNGFLNILESIEENITAPESITDIIVCGGYNDNGQTYADLITAINTFMAYCHSTYINARVHLGVNGWGIDDTVRKGIVENVMPAYHDGAISNHECFIEGVYLTAHDYNKYVYSTGNYGIHPSDYTDMGLYIANYLLNGVTGFSKRERNNLTSVATAYRSNDSITGGSYDIFINDESTTIYLSAQMSLDGATFTARNAFQLFTFNDEKTIARINPNLTTYCGMVTCLITAGGTVYNDYAFFQIISGRLARLTPLVSRTNVTQLLIQGIQLTIPSKAC